MFETKRLLVRHVETADVDAMYAVYSDGEVMRWVGDGQPLDRGQCEQWVVVTQRNYASRGYGMSALLERRTRYVIGFCGLVHPGGQSKPEIKYALRRESWGQGFATEAVSAMLAYAASSLGIAQVIATAAPENTASHRVLRKSGMQLGELRQNEDDSLTQFFVWRPSLSTNAL